MNIIGEPIHGAEMNLTGGVLKTDVEPVLRTNKRMLFGGLKNFPCSQGRLPFLSLGTELNLETLCNNK